MTETGIELSDATVAALKQGGNRFMQELAGEDEQDTAEYDPDNVFLGWNVGGKQQYENLCSQLRHRGFDRDEVRHRADREFADLVGTDRFSEVYLDRSSANVVFISGQRGSGKSFLLRGVSNRESKAGVTTVLTDPKGEYHTNNQYHGIQSHLEKLRRNEKPQRIRTAVLTPIYVKMAREDAGYTIHGQSDDWQYPFAFGFEDLEPDDIYFLLRQAVDTESGQTDARNAAMALKREMRDGWMPANWSDIIRKLEVLHETEDIFAYNGRVKRFRSFVETNYADWKVIDSRDRYSISFEEVFSEYNCIVLNLADGGDTFPDDLSLNPLYAALLIKKVRKLLKQGVIAGPVDLLGDEFHNLAPARTDPTYPPSKKQYRKAVKEDRSLGIRGTFASQEPTDVQEDNFLDQCDYYLIPWNMKSNKRRYLLRRTDIADQSSIQRDFWKTVFRAMNKYQWLLLDMINDRWCVLELASPLANHKEE